MSYPEILLTNSVIYKRIMALIKKERKGVLSWKLDEISAFSYF